MNPFVAKASINIQTPATKVWEALTTPELIRQYFFGTNTFSDWKVGSPLIFRGEWEGKTYEDKGVILENVPNKLFRYNYLSSMSGLEDTPENYANITYELTEENGNTRLDITQDNVASEQARNHSEQNWQMVLSGLKEVVEK